MHMACVPTRVGILALGEFIERNADFFRVSENDLRAQRVGA